MTRRTLITFAFVLTLFAAIGSSAQAQPAPTWRAGVAQVVITPAEPMWMSGYGARTAPADGKQDDLMAKAVVLESPASGGAAKSQAVLITLDLVGIDRDTSQELCERLKKKHGFERRQIGINTSHTHCGPVVGRNLGAMYSISDAQWKQVDDYRAVLLDKLVDVLHKAVADPAPVRARWGSGTATCGDRMPGRSRPARCSTFRVGSTCWMLAPRPVVRHRRFSRPPTLPCGR